jgi:hypothetical protein
LYVEAFDVKNGRKVENNLWATQGIFVRNAHNKET